MATTTGIKLDDETRNELKELGRRRNRSPHWLMKQAIKEYLHKEKSYALDIEEDLRRIEKFKETGEGVDNKVVLEWLNDLAKGKKRSWREYT